MCNKSLTKGFIQPHASLDNSLPGSDVTSSSAEQPRNDKSQLNVHMLWEKSKTKFKTKAKKIPDVCSIQEQSSTSSNKEQYSDVCSKKEQVFTKCSKKKQDKSCQVNMRPVK